MSSESPTTKPVVFSKQEVDALPVLGFPEPGRMHGGFQTIFANESAPTNELTFGIARFPARTPEQTAYEDLHKNTPAEFYYILQGRMVLVLEGVYHKVSAGHAIYIPAGGEHGFCNPSTEEELVFTWGLATHGSAGIESVFSEEQPDWSKVEW